MLGALLLPAATGCGVVGAAVAPTGARPGVDVPGDSGDWADAPLGRPALAPPGTGGYMFTMTRPDGSPVAFDPCRPIHVVERPDGAPAGGHELLWQVFGELSRATGLQFVDDGATTEAPASDRPAYQPKQYGDRWAPVLVAWSDSEAGDMLASDDAGQVILGRAGPVTFGAGDDARYVTGIAVFNAPELAAQMQQGQDEKARAVLLHELASAGTALHAPEPLHGFGTRCSPSAEQVTPQFTPAALKPQAPPLHRFVRPHAEASGGQELSSTPSATAAQVPLVFVRLHFWQVGHEDCAQQT